MESEALKWRTNRAQELQELQLPTAMDLKKVCVCIQRGTSCRGGEPSAAAQRAAKVWKRKLGENEWDRSFVASGQHVDWC